MDGGTIVLLVFGTFMGIGFLAALADKKAEPSVLAREYEISQNVMRVTGEAALKKANLNPDGSLKRIK